jgi:2-dehydro-3-deoxygalactonokinase
MSETDGVSTAAAALIGLDWGTTSFRAYRIAADGRVLERHGAPAGILQIEGGDFGGALERQIGPWLQREPEVPVLAAGMITSRQGWVEVPYAACPAGETELARGLGAHRAASGAMIRFVPGVAFEGGDGVPDVIRGEETQIVGQLGDPDASGRFVMPGTHSKWVRVEGGRITAFATFMTGEVYGVLKGHSILGRLMAGEGDDGEAFGRGLAHAGEGGGGLLRRLFSARTLALFGRLPETGVASYLSGLLIGSEIGEGLDWMGGREQSGVLTVVGTSELAARYRQALAGRGVEAAGGAEDAAAHGLFRIARAGGLLG